MNRPPRPNRATFLSDLSPAMARGLVRCQSIPIQVLSDLPRPGGVARATLAALERYGLIEVRHDRRARQVWRPTERGMALITADEPRLLGLRCERVEVGWGELKREVLIEEPEAVDELTQKRLTERAHAVDAARRAGVDAELIATRQRLAHDLPLLALAEARGLDVRSERRMIERMLEAIEAKVRKQTTARAA